MHIVPIKYLYFCFNDILWLLAMLISITIMVIISQQYFLYSPAISFLSVQPSQKWLVSVKPVVLAWQDVNIEEQCLTIRRRIRYDDSRHKNIIEPIKRKK